MNHPVKTSKYYPPQVVRQNLNFMYTFPKEIQPQKWLITESIFKDVRHSFGDNLLDSLRQGTHLAPVLVALSHIMLKLKEKL
jgi:hypothetical protein